MKGHEKIIDMRLQGKVPTFVFLNDYPCQTNWFEFDDSATVCTYEDPIHSMDLRFLVDLNVNISSPTEKRAKEIFEAVKKSGAALVAACHVQNDKHPLEQSGWYEIYRK